jgi:hypothetical protein
MFVKPLERADARSLRREGMSLKRIAAILEVSPSSVLKWTRDIELTPEQKDALFRACSATLDDGRLRRGHQTWAARCRSLREQAQREGRERARTGEGGKGRNAVKFSNSDAYMVRVFRRFLTESLGVQPAAIRLSLNVYTTNGISIEQIERHWLDLLELPADCMRKHTLNHMPTSSSGRAHNKLPYGVCTLYVHSTRVVQHIYGAIQEYGGFDEPAWLG